MEEQSYRSKQTLKLNTTSREERRLIRVVDDWEDIKDKNMINGRDKRESRNDVNIKYIFRIGEIYTGR